LTFLALFFTAPRTRAVSDSTIDPVEVMLFPPTKLPKVRFENARLQRLSADIAISMTLPESPHRHCRRRHRERMAMVRQ